MTTTNVESAERTLSELQAKREQLVADGHKLVEERGKIAFQAHVGDKAARRRLDEVNRSVATHESELASLEAAIAEAARRVQQAKRDEVSAADRAKAQAAHKLVGELSDAAVYLDKHLEAAAKALIAIERGVTELHDLGFTSPSHTQLRLGVAQTIQTWAHKLPRSWHEHLRDGLAFLPPQERKTFTQYWSAVAASLGNAIRQRLGNAPVTQAMPQESVT
jgi:hypothetical protein